MSARGLVGCLLRERQRVRPCIMLPSERWASRTSFKDDGWKGESGGGNDGGKGDSWTSM